MGLKKKGFRIFSNLSPFFHQLHHPYHHRGLTIITQLSALSETFIFGIGVIVIRFYGRQAFDLRNSIRDYLRSGRSHARCDWTTIGARWRHGNRKRNASARILTESFFPSSFIAPSIRLLFHYLLNSFFIRDRISVSLTHV